MIIKILISAILALSVAAIPRKDELERYPQWASIMKTLGYDWESYTTKTADGWTLTLFRITGKIVDGKVKTLVTVDTPVLVQHGMGMDALAWAEWSL